MGRNIVITPNRSSTGSTQQPNISFSGLSAGTISLLVEDDGSLVYDGVNGSLFSISDNKDGLLNSVNDVSGLPIFQVWDDNRIILGVFNNPALTISASTAFVGPTATTASILHISGGTLTYKDGNQGANKVLVSDANGIASWQTLSSTAFTGGTVTGATNFTGGLTANTISATTYQNLPTDIRVTGATYSNNTFIFTNNTGGTFNVLFNTVTGLTINGNLTVTGSTTSNSLSATTITGTTITGSGSGLTNIPIAGVTNLQSSLDNKFDKSGGTVTGSVLVTGDVTILGTATTINTQTLTVKDNIITINNNYTGNTVPYPGTSGIEVLRGSATTATILWDETSQKWVAGVTGNTKQILFSGDSLSLLSSGHTHPISEIVNLQSSLDNKFDKTGGTISGDTLINGGLTANTISATTYYNLPITTDTYVTGATYSNNTFTYTNNTGGTFNVLFNTLTGVTITGDLIVSGNSQSLFSGNSSIELVKIIQTGTGDAFVVEDQGNTDPSHFVINASGNTAIGLTQPIGDDKLTVSGNTSIYGTLKGTTISATTYQNLPISTDITITGASYSNNTFTFTNNTGGTFSTLFNTVTGLTVNGILTVTGNTSVRGLTGTSATISGSAQNILTIIGSGSTSPLFSVVGSSGELFSITDSLTGSLFSVNDISGLPILEVFSDNTTLMGNYLAPSLNTTARVTLTAGTNTVYSIPTSAYTGAFFDYVVISSGSTGARAGNIMAIWSGTTAEYTDVSTNDIGNTAGITFSVVVSGNNAVLRSSATTAGWTLKTIIRSI